ncbi:MAG: transketolase C-terminal domain-containing protein [Anaerolineae bacterium]
MGADGSSVRGGSRRAENGSIELIDLRTIVRGINRRCLNRSRRRAECLIVHEDGITGGFGAEIAATIAQEAFFDLDAPIVRLGTLDTLIPYSGDLSHSVVPTAENSNRDEEAARSVASAPTGSLFIKQPCVYSIPHRLA